MSLQTIDLEAFENGGRLARQHARQREEGTRGIVRASTIRIG